jgi:hypothetical protein
MMKTQRKYEGRISEKKGIGSILFRHGSVETECHIYIYSRSFQNILVLPFHPTWL